MKNPWISHLVLGSLITGCGNHQDPLVAGVGQHQITSTSLRAFVEQVPPGLRPQKTGEAARMHYLQALVDGRLLLLEAQARGLDTTQVVQKAVRNAVDDRVRALYRAQEIPSPAQVSEEEVRHHFEAEGFDRERLFWGIVVETRAQIDQVVRELQAGRSFEQVADAYSQDERSAQQRGELGFIGRDRISRFYIPPDVFRSLPIGEVSNPLPTGRGAWHVIRFSDERTASFEKYRSFIRMQLSKERRRQAEKEHFELLKETFQVRLNPTGLQELREAYRQRNPAVLSASSNVLYTLDKGEIRVAEAQEALEQLNISRGLVDSTGAVSVLERTVLRPFLLVRAARRAGLYEKSEIHQLEERKKEDILLETLKEAAVTQHINLSEEELRHYYDTHPKIFRVETPVWVEEILLPTEAEAQQVQVQLLAGASFEDFAGRSLRAGARENKAQFHFHSQGKVLYPRLVPAIMAAPGKELVGPVEVADGYSVFRVLGREPDSIEPYEKARRRARSLLRRQREAQGLAVLVKGLREKYASQVKIYDSHLSEALPDSLVQG